MSILTTPLEVVPYDASPGALVEAVHDLIVTEAGVYSVAFTSVDGPSVAFCLLNADTGAQLTVGVNGADILIGAEPSGSLTAYEPGSPTGLTTDYQETTLVMTGYAATSNAWLNPHGDAYSLLIGHATSDWWANSAMFGYVYDPAYPSVDVPNGRDGLGLFTGYPNLYSTTGGMFSYNGNSRVHVATDNWKVPRPRDTFTASDAFAEDASIVGFIRPNPVDCLVYRSVGSSPSLEVCLGRFKYFLHQPVVRDAKTVIVFDNDTDLAFVYGSLNTGSGYGSVMPWKRGVVPL
jgi:hypothetical protein